MERHQKQPFRWCGQMKNLSFFNFDEEEKRRVKFLNQTGILKKYIFDLTKFFQK